MPQQGFCKVARNWKENKSFVKEKHRDCPNQWQDSLCFQQGQAQLMGEPQPTGCAVWPKKKRKIQLRANKTHLWAGGALSSQPSQVDKEEDWWSPWSSLPWGPQLSPQAVPTLRHRKMPTCCPDPRGRVTQAWGSSHFWPWVQVGPRLGPPGPG